MPLRVVIAEDEAITRMDIREKLEAIGYQIAGEANDGFVAVELSRQYKPDLVLMDIKMPIIDGLSAARVIRQEDLAGCIVLLTAYCDDEFLRIANEIGVMGYLIKPIDEKTLIPTLEVAIARSKEIRDLKQNLNYKDNILEERKIIEKAKGIIMHSKRCDEKEAYEYLRNMSMMKRTSMKELSQLIITSSETTHKLQ